MCCLLTVQSCSQVCLQEPGRERQWWFTIDKNRQRRLRLSISYDWKAVAMNLGQIVDAFFVSRLVDTALLQHMARGNVLLDDEFGNLSNPSD